MNKPNNYDKAPIGSSFEPIELGGHILVIKDVQETTSKSGKEMIVVRFDFAQGDKQPGYFTEQFANDIRPDKKWPNAGTAYILTEDSDGNCSRNFKTFTTSVEKSNRGFEIQWGDKFAGCFKNKFVGGVFGVVEEEYGGKVHSTHKLRWFRSANNALDEAAPKEKLLDKSGESNNFDDFMPAPDDISEKLPF